MSAFDYRICPRSQAADVCASYKPTHLVTLLDPGSPQAPAGGTRTVRCLHIPVLDISSPGEIHGPSPAKISSLIDFGRQIGSGSRTLVNCEAGVSRSTAASLILALCQPDNPGPDPLWDDLKARYPRAAPNPLMLDIADGLLGLGGALSRRARVPRPGPLPDYNAFE